MNTDTGALAHGCIDDSIFVYGKGYTCPVCGDEFKNPTVKSAKVRMVRSDTDLRPVYEGIVPLKYEVVFCRKCGYAALERYFNDRTQVQKKLLKEKITATYKTKEKPEEKATLSFDDAYYRYRMALACAVAAQAKDSEKAYICLKTAWLLRSWKETLEGNVAAVAKLESLEMGLLKNAKEGFTLANTKEDYPLCGMDEATVDYLLAALSAKFGEYENAMKLLSGIIANRGANNRVRDRARDLKDEISKMAKASEQAQ